MSDLQPKRASKPTCDERTVDGGSASALREPVTLVKGSHRWTFTCETGEESALLKRLSELASDGDVPFDWFDAALVSHQLSKRLRPGINRIESARPPGVSGK
jgi:hypothetical protein